MKGIHRVVHGRGPGMVHGLGVGVFSSFPAHPYNVCLGKHPSHSICVP